MSGEQIKSCWNCKYQDITTPAFLGTCTWFVKHNKGEDKDIPPEIVEKDASILRQSNEIKMLIC